MAQSYFTESAGEERPSLMPDVVLCRPGFARNADAHWSAAPPLSLAYLAAAVRDSGLSVAVVDGKTEGHRNIAQTATRVLEQNPAIVGLSMMTPEYNQAAQIAKVIKEHRPGTFVVAGGAHVNALPKESLRECGSFDTAVAGEAEVLFPRLAIRVLKGDDSTEVEGALYKDHLDTVESVLCRKHLPDVDGLPLPAWDLFPRSRIYPVMTERGCPFACVFCSHNLSRHVRRRSVESVIAEIEWVKKQFAPDWIYIEDETFGLNTERTLSLLQSILRVNSDRKLRFKAQTRVDCMEREVLRSMREAGFEYLEVGVESGDPDVLERSGKGIRLEQVAPAIQMAKSVGIKSWLKFIIGLPGETPASVRRTIDFIVNLNPDRLSVATIVAYPGSQVYDWARNGENGYHLVSNNWDSYDKYLGNSIRLDTLSSKAMKRLQIQTYFEVYIRNGRLAELSRFLWDSRSFVVPAAKALFGGSGNEE